MGRSAFRDGLGTCSRCVSCVTLPNHAHTLQTFYLELHIRMRLSQNPEPYNPKPKTLNPVMLTVLVQFTSLVHFLASGAYQNPYDDGLHSVSNVDHWKHDYLRMYRDDIKLVVALSCVNKGWASCLTDMSSDIDLRSLVLWIDSRSF
eukprot:352629-Chlamydomonas_euryale.AAC.6